MSSAKPSEQIASSPSPPCPESEQPTAYPGIVGEKREPQNLSVNVEATSNRAAWVRRLSLMGALFLPVLIETLDYTVVATAQPHIASALNELQLQNWIGLMYVLASTTFLPLWGCISDVFGRHQALQSAILLFLVGSAMCTGASQMPVLLGGRGLCGVGAAGLLAVSRIILFESNNLDDSVYQSTMFAVLHGFGYGFGPVLGGLLASTNWRWVFAINLPVAVLSSILAFVLIRKLVSGPQPPRPRPRLPSPNATTNNSPFPILAEVVRIDLLGALLFISGATSILLALHWGSVGEWQSARVIGCFVAGGVLMVLFIVWENTMNAYELGKRSPPKMLQQTEAMIPVTIFTSYDVCACCFTSLTSGAVVFGVFYELAVFFAVSRGDSATKGGVQLLYFLPGLGVGLIFSMLVIKRLRQPKYVILIGGLILSVALGLVSRGLHRNVSAEIYGFLGMTGVGLGLVLSATTIHSRFSQPPERIAAVVSIVTFFNICGGTVGLAQLSAVLNSQTRRYIVGRIRDGTLSPSEVQLLGMSGLEGSQFAISSIQRIGTLPKAVQEVIKAGYREGVRWAMISLIPWTGVSFAISFGLQRIQENR